MPRKSKVAKGAATQKDRSRYEQQFLKTKPCSFYAKGKCTRGDQCTFAHGDVELQALPDLSKTSLCQDYAEFGACHNLNCCFAHGVEELRATTKFYKTSMCKFHMMRQCRMGVYCRHAHDESELQELPTEAFQKTQEELLEEQLLPSILRECYSVNPRICEPFKTQTAAYGERFGIHDTAPHIHGWIQSDQTTLAPGNEVSEVPWGLQFVESAKIMEPNMECIPTIHYEMVRQQRELEDPSGTLHITIPGLFPSKTLSSPLNISEFVPSEFICF